MLLKALLSKWTIFTSDVLPFKSRPQKIIRSFLCRLCLRQLSSAYPLKRPFFPLRSDLPFAFVWVHIPFAVGMGLGKDLRESVNYIRMVSR